MKRHGKLFIITKKRKNKNTVTSFAPKRLIQNRFMDRKDFIKTSLALCALGTAGAAAFLESCKKNNSSSAAAQGPTVNFTLDLTQPANSALNSSGGAVASNGVLVVNTGSGYVAVAQKCTHNGCSVGYNQSGNGFVCPCHGGSYDINGNVTGGPPPAPIKKYTVVKNGNILTISG
jgi:cytochrome b6-f complex iron-sulfur subunit